MKIRLLIGSYVFFFVSLGTFTAASQKINISIFNALNLQTVLVTPVSGNYSLITGDEEFILRPNQIIYISRSGDSVKVRDMSSNLGTWKRVSLVGKGENDVVRVNPVAPTQPARIYDDNLGFYVDFGRLMVVNLIDIDKYVAGVVEAEAGPNAHIEFYKAQALLARTYALGHLERHSGEGFNMCDEVHCQAYKGKSGRSMALLRPTRENPGHGNHPPRGEEKDLILRASRETSGQVVVDAEGKLIVGAFHANCGGETANAGDVWLTPKSYLVSVQDNYCRSSASANWEVRIPLDEWRDFLKTKGVDAHNIPDNKLAQSAKNREYAYKIGGKQIPFTEIRNHFKLRSAFMSIDIVSGAVRIRGRGYGHGVGMCQDGAMQMARRGMSYDKIIDHYFTNVKTVPYSSLDPAQHTDDIEMAGAE